MGNLISIMKCDNDNTISLKKHKKNVTKTTHIRTPEYIPSPNLQIPMNF